jgi:signal transduction histidine kinase
MWSRLSLRLQIGVVLVLVLAGEALFGCTLLFWLLRNAFLAQDRDTAQQLIERTEYQLELECSPDYAETCIRYNLQDIMDAGGFEWIQFQTDAANVRLGSNVEPPPESRRRLSATGTGRDHATLSALLSPLHANRRAASVFAVEVTTLFSAVLLFTLVGAWAFNRTVARPVDRLSAIADRIGHLQLDDMGRAIGGMVDEAGPMLGQLGVSFERMSKALQVEQERTAAQIAELTRINRELKEARDSLVRQEKLATVGRLAAGVAHEVGNPLGGILGYAELLKVKGDATSQEYAERIEREVARIDKTVRGLLDFARPGDARLSPIQLQPVVQSALGLCHADKRFREVQVEQALPEGLPQVFADEHRLGQVLVNLLLNAGDAMQGKGRVRVTAEVVPDERPRRRASDPAPSDRLRVVVEDTGPGIPPEALPRIFDPFFTTKDVGQGTGLGLSICASIMDGFGGDIHAENRVDQTKGARFIFHLRVAGPVAPS